MKNIDSTYSSSIEKHPVRINDKPCRRGQKKPKNWSKNGRKIGFDPLKVRKQHKFMPTFEPKHIKNLEVKKHN